MTKIYMKDIKNLCNCIVGLSCQTIRTKKAHSIRGIYIHARYIRMAIVLHFDSLKTIIELLIHTLKSLCMSNS